MHKQIPTSAIRVGRRHRKDLGNVRALAKSIQEIGLLHPPVVRPDGLLIAGERRLHALKLLGWKKVPVTVLDLDLVIRGEVAENVCRQDFRPSEMVQIARALEPLLRKEAKARQGKRNDLVENFHEVEVGKTRDKLSACVGVSGRTLEKMMAIVDAADQHPRKFGRLKDLMDRTGKTSRPYRALRVKDELRVLNLRPAPGRFKTLVLDCPWEYEQDLRGWGRPTYATMSVDQLLALPVPQWADENSHIYCWTTNAMMADALRLVTSWGFKQKTILTWAKDRFALGAYFRNQTEHVIFGVKGRLETRAQNIPTIFHAPQGKDSAKPECFYDIVRRASYPPFGEAFQRTARPDFVNLYAASSEAAEPGRVIRFANKRPR